MVVENKMMFIKLTTTIGIRYINCNIIQEIFPLTAVTKAGSKTIVYLKGHTEDSGYLHVEESAEKILTIMCAHVLIP